MQEFYFVQKCISPFANIELESDTEDEATSKSTSKSNEVTWYQWERVVNSLGKEHTCTFAHFGDLSELYELFCKSLPQFLQHSCIKRVQSNSYEKCKTALADSPKKAMLQVDFAENMSCEWQDAIQSSYWNKMQITIFTSVLWYRSETISRVVVSDDRGHNKESIVPFIDTLLDGLPQSIHHIDLWSDGPSGQFKNRFIAGLIPWFQKRKNMHIKWNYFATSHGKGPSSRRYRKEIASSAMLLPK